MTTPQAESQKPTPHPGVSVAIIAAVLILTVVITSALNKVPLRSAVATDPPDKSESACHPNDKVTKETSSMKEAPPIDEWTFDTTSVAYPKSKKYGPGFIEHKGAAAAPAYGMCFQRSPEGALFAATHAAAESLQKQPNTDWAEEFISKDQLYTSDVIEAITKGNLLLSLGYESDKIKRIEIVGYRYEYFGRSSALIHIGTKVTTNKDEVTYLTSLYDLTWEANDWKLIPRYLSNPTKTKRVPNLDGYISWR